MHIHSSQYKFYILHGLPEVTLHSTRHEVILHGLREVTSERQVISHDGSVMSMVLMVKNDRKCTTYIYFYNKTIIDLCIGRHGVLLNSKLIIVASAPRRSI